MTKSIFTDDYTFFRKLLRGEREKLKMSQKDLGKLLNKPQSFVHKYETGERRLDLIEFLDIADTLKFDPCAFIKRLYEGE